LLYGGYTSPMRTAIAVLLLAASVVAAERSAPFAVGVLRRDGIVVPFATYDGRSWSTRWPKPADDLTIPVTVGSVPSGWWGPTGPLETWQAWPGGAEPRPLKVLQPDWVDTHCVRQIGLRTDYRPEEMPPPPNVQPYPKDGLAVAPPRPVEKVRVVPTQSDEASAVVEELVTAFNRAERQTANRFSHPLEESPREAITPAIEAMYAHGGDPRVYYIEALREYTPLGSRECQAAAFGTGWFVRENGAIRSLAMAVDLLDCERHGASYMLPLGVVRDGTRVFWVVQFSGFEQERYAVIEPRAKKVDAVANVWGGGC
jgi:hypothetical protein